MDDLQGAPDDELPPVWPHQNLDYEPQNSTLQCADEHSAAQHVKVMLWAVGGPVILVIGLVGNVLIVATMRQRLMRKTSTAVYLVSMAVLDLTVLVVGLTPHWLANCEYLVLKERHSIGCKLEKFLDYSTGDAAVWVRVAFTLDRLIAVVLPLYAGRFCGDPGAARYYVAAAVVVAVAKNTHVAWTRGVQLGSPCASSAGANVSETTLVVVSNCGFPAQYQFFEMFVRPWITFIVVSVLPFCTIAVCNTLIVVSLVRRRRSVMMLGRSVAGGVQKEQQFVQMAAMCVAASMLFLVCTAPNIIMLIGRPHWDRPPRGNRAYETVKAVSNLLYYVTFSANFFLYCVTGDRFRSALRALLRRAVARSCPCLLSPIRRDAWSRSSIYRRPQSTLSTTARYSTVSACTTTPTALRNVPWSSTSPQTSFDDDCVDAPDFRSDRTMTTTTTSPAPPTTSEKDRKFADVVVVELPHCCVKMTNRKWKEKTSMDSDDDVFVE